MAIPKHSRRRDTGRTDTMNSKDDYGLEDAEAAAEAFGQANAKPPKIKARRANKLDVAHAALLAGEPIPFLPEAFGSLANPWQHKFAVALYSIYDPTSEWAEVDAPTIAFAERPEAIEAFKIGGCNTYAKLLQHYRSILLASAHAGVYPDNAIPVVVKTEEGATKSKTGKLTITSGDPVAPFPPSDEPVYAVGTGRANLDIRKMAGVFAKAVDEMVADEFEVDNAPAAALPVETPVAPVEQVDAVETYVTVEEADAYFESEVDVYPTKGAAVKAAKAALGDDATSGLDFNIVGEGKRWSWAQVV